MGDTPDFHIITDSSVLIYTRYALFTFGTLWSGPEQDLFSYNDEFTNWMTETNITPSLSVSYERLPQNPVYVYTKPTVENEIRLGYSLSDEDMKISNYTFLRVILPHKSSSSIIEGYLFEFRNESECMMFRFRWL